MRATTLFQISPSLARVVLRSTHKSGHQADAPGSSLD
jgi:hypothetical protein